jgi:sugar-specific transcriptional regulator TrmB
MEDTIKSLESIGFTNYEAKVFHVLFQGHLLTASDIAKKAGIPRSSSYDVLKSFTEKGICNEVLTSSVARYEIIDPKVVEDKIEKEIQDTFKDKMGKLKDSFEKLQPLFKAKELEGQKVDVELIKGFNRHRFAKFMEIFKSAEKEALLMTKLEGFVDSSVDEITLRFLSGGGTLKTLYEASENFKIRVDNKWKQITRNELPDFCQTLVAEGEQIKLADKIYQNMLVVDRKIVFISLVDPTIVRYNRSDIIVKNENFATSMADYFEGCWAVASTPNEYKAKISVT